jgi:hypothetical protein
MALATGAEQLGLFLFFLVRLSSYFTIPIDTIPTMFIHGLLLTTMLNIFYLHRNRQSSASHTTNLSQLGLQLWAGLNKFDTLRNVSLEPVDGSLQQLLLGGRGLGEGVSRLQSTIRLQHILASVD